MKKLKDEQRVIEATSKGDNLRMERRGGVRESMINFMKVSEIMQQQIHLEEKIKELTKKAQEEISQCKINIKKYEEDLAGLKNSRRFIKIKLKELYSRVLETEDEALMFGRPYFQVVQALWELKEVLSPKQFAKIIDRDSANFLMDVRLLANLF